MVACDAARGGIVTDGADAPVLLVVVIAVVASLGPATEVHAAAAAVLA